MRIVHVIPSVAPSLGGPSKAVIGMARAVARCGHHVEIHTTTLRMDNRKILNGTRRCQDGVEIYFHRVHEPARLTLAASMPLLRALRRSVPRADIVHLHSLYLFHCWATARVCSAFNVPYILQPHGTLDPYLWHRHWLPKRLVEGLFQNRVTRGAAAILFTTEEEQLLAQPYVFGRPGFIAPIGVDLQEYGDLPSPGDFRDLHPEVKERPIVLFLGRLNFKKGLDILMPAFHATLHHKPDAHLVIAGPDHGMRAKTEAWVAKYGLADKVTFTGMVGGREMLALLQDSSVFVLPSYSENFGMAVVEAMACGIPVVIFEQGEHLAGSRRGQSRPGCQL